MDGYSMFRKASQEKREELLCFIGMTYILLLKFKTKREIVILKVSKIKGEKQKYYG